MPIDRVDTSGLLQIALGFIGILAGLAFNAAMQPIVMWADRSRQLDEGVDSLSRQFAELESALLQGGYNPEREYAAIIDAASKSSASKSGSLARRLVSAMRNVRSSEQRLSAVILGLIRGWLEDKWNREYADSALQHWTSFTNLDGTAALAEIRIDPDRAKRITPAIDQALNSVSIRSAFASVRQYSAFARTSNNLWWLLFVTLALSAALAESGIILFGNAIQHDWVVADTAWLMSVFYRGFVALLFVAETIGFIFLLVKATDRLSFGDILADRNVGLATLVCDPFYFDILSAACDFLLAGLYLTLIGALAHWA